MPNRGQSYQSLVERGIIRMPTPPAGEHQPGHRRVDPTHQFGDQGHEIGVEVGDVDGLDEADRVALQDAAGPARWRDGQRTPDGRRVGSRPGADGRAGAGGPGGATTAPGVRWRSGPGPRAGRPAPASDGSAGAGAGPDDARSPHVGDGRGRPYDEVAVTRHVWVRTATGWRPGLLTRWRRTPDGTWVGQVAHAARDDAGLVQDWIPAALLRPADTRAAIG